MQSTIPIPNSSWKEIENIIFKSGTNAHTIEASADNLQFMLSLEIISINSGEISLTDKGTDLFKALFVVNEREIADNIIMTLLLRYPVVSLFIQVFIGRGAVTRQQVWNLLCHHNIITPKFPIDNLGNLLATLNKFKIIRYDKRNSKVTIIHQPTEEASLPQYFVSETTPYSNVNNLRKILRDSKGRVCWIDKHFRKEGFEPIIDALDGQFVSYIDIVSGKDNATQPALNDYANAKSELLHRNIELNWWVCTDQNFLSKWHDRWIIADNHCFNIPPVLSIIRGQKSEMLKTPHKPNAQEFFDHSELC